MIRKAMHFYKQQYSASRLSQLDVAWYVLYIIMTAVGKHVLVTKREQTLFEFATVVAVAVLILKVSSPRIYAQWRPAIVFLFHIMLTTLRALATLSMAPAQATFWRPMRDTVSGHNSDSLLFYFCTILGVTGGSHRTFELLGLQQPYRYHAIITLYYVVVQFAAGLKGYRMGYANALFYVSHQGDDAMTAALDTVIEGIIPLPRTEQAICSSCPGISLYTTVLLYTGAVLPLYILYVLEQAAYKRFISSMMVPNALRTADQQQLTLQEDGHAQQQDQLGLGVGASDGMQEGPPQRLRRRWQASGYNSSLQEPDFSSVQRDPQQAPHTEREQLHRPQLQQLQEIGNALSPQASTAFPPELGLPSEVQGALQQDIAQGCLLTNCLRQFVILLGLLLVCWCFSLVGTAVVMKYTGASLEWWCPNRPRPPFLIAGQVYGG